MKGSKDEDSMWTKMWWGNPNIQRWSSRNNPDYWFGGDKRVIENASNVGYRIRKLTPKECWRLMGFSDEDFEKAQNAGVSNTQLYKQAGNSIVTDVLYYIFKELYNAMPYLFEDLKVSSYFSGIGAFEIALNRLFNDINNQTTTAPETSGGKRSNYIWWLQ